MSLRGGEALGLRQALWGSMSEAAPLWDSHGTHMLALGKGQSNSTAKNDHLFPRLYDV